MISPARHASGFPLLSIVPSICQIGHNIHGAWAVGDESIPLHRASVGVPFEVSTVTAEPNVTAASTVSPSLQTPSAPGSETTSAAVTAGAPFTRRHPGEARDLVAGTVPQAVARLRPLVATLSTRGTPDFEVYQTTETEGTWNFVSEPVVMPDTDVVMGRMSWLELTTVERDSFGNTQEHTTELWLTEHGNLCRPGSMWDCLKPGSRLEVPAIR